MKKYKLYDNYEGYMNLLGEFDNEKDVVNVFNNKRNDTEDDCCLVLCVYSDELNIYQNRINWCYTKNQLLFTYYN